MSRPAAVLRLALLLLCLAAGDAAADVEGFHYTREVTVAAPGWVRVPLDLAAVQHLAPGAADLHVISPAGEEVPLRIEPAATRTERRPVEAPRPVRSEDGGWELTLDLGADPVPHERLFLQTVRPLPPPSGIESSPDGAAWQPLATGEPGRVDPEEDGGWLSLSYPATGDRYLRLRWPRGPAAPAVAAAEIESVTGPTLSVITRNAGCDTSRPGAAFCTLALPAAGQVVRRLTLEIAGAGRIGYRLDAPREGRWQLQAEGVWQRSGGRTRHLLAGGPEPVADSILRLELHGSPEAPPRLASWAVELTVQTVLFHAAAAGRYTLAYGGPPRARTPAAEPPPAAGESPWLEAGTELEHAPPSLPAAATAPSVRLGNRRLAAAWRVVARNARPGSLVRLELPDDVYGAARADLGNLRLVAGERQIPFYRWSPAAPILAVREPSARPAASGRRSRESELEIHLPEPGLPLTELDLTAPASLLRRTVGVRYLEPARVPRRENGRRKNRPALVRETWECRPQPPLPCQARLPLSGRAPRLLSVRFYDGDNPPLADLEATVWRRRDVLLFVWPAGEEPVRLLAGPETLRTPSYDLAALGETLLSHPWQPAELSLTGDASPSEPWWNRWVMPLTLTIASVCLVLLLRRILSEA
jgi:uncharacterized protein DUF3999